MLLVDTDILVDLQRRVPGAMRWYASLRETPTVTGFSAMEMIQGARDAHEVKMVVDAVAPLAVIWPSDIDCRKALELFARVHLSHRLGLIDSLIACTALGLGAELCTFNVKHFGAVEGLKLVQPYTR